MTAKFPTSMQKNRVINLALIRIHLCCTEKLLGAHEGLVCENSVKLLSSLALRNLNWVTTSSGFLFSVFPFHPLGEEPFPDIQTELPMTPLHAVPLGLRVKRLVPVPLLPLIRKLQTIMTSPPPPQTHVLQAEQNKWSQPLLIWFPLNVPVKSSCHNFLYSTATEVTKSTATVNVTVI